MVPEPTTSIFEAVQSGSLPAVKELLDANPDLADAIEPETGENALAYAAWMGRVDILTLILNRAKNKKTIINEQVRSGFQK
jgi:hypothetical protein